MHPTTLYMKPQKDGSLPLNIIFLFSFIQKVSTSYNYSYFLHYRLYVLPKLQADSPVFLPKPSVSFLVLSDTLVVPIHGRLLIFPV